MNIEKVTLRHLQMEMKAPFTTSFGTLQTKDFILLEAEDSQGVTGWGESVAFAAPWYSEETLQTNWHMLEDFLIPLLFQGPLEHPADLNAMFAPIRKNNMAKAALEGAIWDIYAQQQNLSLSKALGGNKAQIEVGISIGIQSSVKALLNLIEDYATQGYRRMKIKIKPGWDIEVLREVRRGFPSIPLMADANSAYTLRDLETLRALDEFNLTMVEQPLASDDIIDHAKLQAVLSTPVCLDESIHSVEDARKAIELGSCKVINIKVGRVGGLWESKKIHDLCKEKGIPVWCGGMLESGVGRAHNIAITTLENFVLPGDTAASSRYWERDIIQPEVTVLNGLITVPEHPGLGYKVDRKQVENFTLATKTFRLT